MIRKIVDVHNPVLRQKAKKILRIDKKILKLISDMEDTLKSQNDPEGVGLAAPQIGKSFALFIVDYKEVHRAIINPEIVEISKMPKKTKSKRKSENLLEGCLSLPHFYGPIDRPKSITIKYQNIDGQEILEKFEDFFAQIIQHEIDHLNGVLFIDHILSQKSPLYQFKGQDNWEEVTLK